MSDEYAWVVDGVGFTRHLARVVTERGGATVAEVELLAGLAERLAGTVRVLRGQLTDHEAHYRTGKESPEDVRPNPVRTVLSTDLYGWLDETDPYEGG